MLVLPSSQCICNLSAADAEKKDVDENIEKLRKQIDAVEAKIGQPLISDDVSFCECYLPPHLN